jgi:hypothetical protein
MKKRFTLIICLGLLATTATAQSITLHFTETPLKEVLKEIQNQTDYKFIYNDNLIGASNLVSISVDAQSLTKVLDELLSKNNLIYAISDKQIVLQYKPPTANAPVAPAPPQEVRVTGRIVDAITGEAIPYATIVLKGITRIWTTSDNEGKFGLLLNNPATDVLVVNFLGYEQAEIAVSNRSVLTISLHAESRSLDAARVVATGYQTISRERATGSYSVIGVESLEQKPTFNISNAMVGLVPGLAVQSAPVDGSTRFIIRGQGTLQTDQTDRDPLIVVDGFPINGFGGAG